MNTVTVVGEASVDVLPDRVEWTLDVDEVDASPRVAFDRCATRVDALAKALAAFEVTTGEIRFSPEWHSQGHKTTGRQIASAALIVTAPVDQAAVVATAAMDAGADELHGPWLRYPEERATLDALLPRAVEHARANAQAIAAAAGRRLGRVLSVTDPEAAVATEERRHGRRRRGMVFASAAAGGDDDHRSVPVIARPQRLGVELVVELELVD